jgi:hypothetical protein
VAVFRLSPKEAIVRIMNKLIASVAFATALVAGTALVSNSSSAATLYDNMNIASVGSTSPIPPPPNSNLGPIDQSFSTGPSAFNLTGLQLLLSGNTDSNFGSFTVSILNDNGGSPTGSVIASSGSLLDSSFLGNTPSALTLTTFVQLTANTLYWIDLSATNDSSVLWWYTADASGIGVANQFYAFNGGAAIGPTSQGAYQAQVTGDLVTPLPSTWLMLLSGFVGLGFFAYRGTKKSAAAIAVA